MAEQKVKNTATWGRESAKARYGSLKYGPVTPAPDEQAPQFKDEKQADHVDVGNEWTRGKGTKSPYPDFDHGDLDKRKPK